MTNHPHGGVGSNQYQTRGHSVAEQHPITPHPDLMAQAGASTAQPQPLPGKWRLVERFLVWNSLKVMSPSPNHIVRIVKGIRSPRLLDQVAHSENLYAAAGAALNPRLPAQTLEYLASVDSDIIRRHVAQRADLPPAIALQLAHDENQAVRSEVARNPASSVEALIYIARNDPDRGNRRYALDNPSCPSQIRALHNLL